VTPYAEFLREFYKAIGLDWESQVIPGPVYNYFFDRETPYVVPGRRGWTRDVYGRGLEEMPYPPQVLADLRKARDAFARWYQTEGGPTDPADHADPAYDYLAGISLDQYLSRTLGLHPAVADFYTRYTVDALTGTAQQVSAFSGISFIGSEYQPIFSLPGGTSGIARHLLKWLVPAALEGTSADALVQSPIRAAELDAAGSLVRVRQRAVALRADTSPGASVVYQRDGTFYRVAAKAVVLAGQGHTAQHLVGHLLSPEARRAFAALPRAPVVVANVILRRAAPLLELGLGYDQYWWGSSYWADFVIADWTSASRSDPERPTVLTFYGGNSAPVESLPEERIKLLHTPFARYEQSLRADLARLLAGSAFDYDRDVRGVFLYRWGHGMVYPRPGLAFGPVSDSAARTAHAPAPRHTARQQIGRISIAGQDVESSPSLESAIGSGLRAAREVLGVL
jgi:spermidine dehydrogenase